MEDNSENDLPKEQKNDEKKSSSNLARKEIGKKAKSEATKKIASSAAKKSMLAALGPFIAAAAGVLFTIVVFAGIAVFLATLPGMAMDMLKELGKAIANGLASWFGYDSTEQVDEEVIYSTLDYLEQMGYDLKGYGFLTEYVDVDDDGDLLDDDPDGVIRDEDSGEIKEASSDFIMAYMISDNYVYTLANENLDIDHDGGFLGWLWGNIQAMGRHIVDFFGGSLGEHWTTGLLTLWDEDGIGVRDGFYSDTGFLNFDNVSLDAEKRVLYMKKGFRGRNTKYKLDGWTGRYGMPLEFLLSVHMATMMPDLSYDMANSFETKINILLHSSGDHYVPYIENVINHWYRNVYYTSVSYDENNEEDGRNLSFVDYDRNYEDIVKERWTLYETDDDGNYLLYIINGNGEYASGLSDVFGDYDNNPKVEKKGIYYVYNGTTQEAAEENIAVAKKAVTIDGSDSNVYSDLEWHQYGNIWAAYREVDGEMLQTGDAMRGETNKEIKEMFLQNKYFKYDGNPDKAEAITAFRKEYEIPYGPLDDVSELQTINWDDTKIIVQTESGPKQYSLSDVTGNVTLNQDSLNSFSMLENTNTLDADYIYKDFKELIVELGYFTKEELTDGTPRVLGWIVPEIGSYGYPKRNLDKVENEFGTMLHSKQDYEAQENALYWNSKTTEPPVIEKDVSVDADDENNNKSKSQDLAFTNYVQSVSGKKKDFLGMGANGEATVTEDFKAAGMDDVDVVVRNWAKRFRKETASKYYSLGNEQEYIEWLESLGGVFSKYAGEKVQGDGDGYSFIDAEKYVYGLMWIAGFEYCAGTAHVPENERRGGYKRCDPFMDAYFEAGDPPGMTQEWGDVYEYGQEANPLDAYYGMPGVGHSHISCAEGPDELGATHIDQAMLDYQFTTCCNVTTDKVYYKAGLFGNGDDNRPKSSSDYMSLINDYGAKIVTEVKDLHLGDIIECFEVDNHTDPDPSHWSEWYHVLFVGEEDEDTITLYTTGSDFTATGDFRHVINRDAERSAVGCDGWIGLHIWDLDIDKERFVGYEGNEAVVSPVTGVLLDYGTYGDSDDDRINVDIRYKKYLDELEKEGIELEYAIPRQEYKEKVGYAKILVLNNENYLKLESGINNKWKGNSLLEKKSSGKYLYREEIYTDEEVDELSAQEKTVYGYKEFAENYEKFGIAGNIIYVDGFRCETEDIGFRYRTDEVYPQGDPIDKSYYDVSPDDLGDKSENKKSKYTKEKRFYSSSKKEESRKNAESKVKKEASPCVGTNGLIFIKEGTVLGRTVTDKELIEKDRENKLGTYDELRGTPGEKDTKYKVIGNYLRVIMREKETDNVVENVEDYMKLSDGSTLIDSLNEMERNEIDYINLRSPSHYKEEIDEMNTPTMDEIKEAAEALGISEEYLKTIIGAVQASGFEDDPYLYYAFACAMINDKPSLEDLDDGFNIFSFSESEIEKGYEKASSDVLKSVYIALNKNNSKIKQDSFEFRGPLSKKSFEDILKKEGKKIIYSSDTYIFSVVECD